MENEKRLIDANEAVKLLRGKCVAKYPNTFMMGLFAAADEIAKQPTVDAVEVVRCKDCKFMEYPTGMCAHPRAIGWDALEPEDNDFCSCGERRDNERKAD